MQQQYLMRYSTIADDYSCSYSVVLSVRHENQLLGNEIMICPWIVYENMGGEEIAFMLVLSLQSIAILFPL